MDAGDALDSISRSAMYTAIWAEYGICTLVMALRAYSQAFVLRKFAADDIVMLGAYIIQGVGSILSTVSTSYGLGACIVDLNYQQIVNVLKYAMISLPFGVIAPLLGRISFILFLLNSVITVHKLRRKLLWGLIVLQTILNIIPCILQFTQCDPVEALWDPLQLLDGCQGAIAVLRFGYFLGGFNGLTDFSLTIAGLVVIASLKMRRSSKIVLCVILSLSSLAMIAAILKAVQLRAVNTPNFSHGLGVWTIWSLTEGTVVIVTASVPRLRAIIVLGRNGNATYTPYLTPEGSNGPPPYEERSRKRRSVRTTYVETSLDDVPIYKGGEDRRADRGDQGSGEAVVLDSGASSNRSVREREGL
ncbi:hypothetical protein BJY00DRAFT_316570 [Aspergillus carlsbadensis]|nr:hypothetical protein BJY00DRAFT_316570 [Aspergillus carlsbadensis]